MQCLKYDVTEAIIPKELIYNLTEDIKCRISNRRNKKCKKNNMVNKVGYKHK